MGFIKWAYDKKYMNIKDVYFLDSSIIVPKIDDGEKLACPEEILDPLCIEIHATNFKLMQEILLKNLEHIKILQSDRLELSETYEDARLQLNEQVSDLERLVSLCDTFTVDGVAREIGRGIENLNRFKYNHDLEKNYFKSLAKVLKKCKLFDFSGYSREEDYASLFSIAKSIKHNNKDWSETDIDLITAGLISAIESRQRSVIVCRDRHIGDILRYIYRLETDKRLERFLETAYAVVLFADKNGCYSVSTKDLIKKSPTDL